MQRLRNKLKYSTNCHFFLSCALRSIRHAWIWSLFLVTKHLPTCRMNASVLCLFLVVTAAITVASTTTLSPTAKPKNTLSVPTIAAPKTTNNQPTTAPKMTNTNPTTKTTQTAPKTTHTAPKTTQRQPTSSPTMTHTHPTTAPRTTHSHPTTVPMTTPHVPMTTAHHTPGNATHSHPTTAPNTTHSHPTTASNTTHSEPTTISETTPRVPKTTAHHTPGNTTKSPAHTTAAAANTTSNATGSTVGTTTSVPTTVPEPENVIPSYEFKNGSEVCMLFVFNATLKVKYNRTNDKSGEATLPIGGKINGMEANWTTFSSCEYVVPRYFGVRAKYPVPDSNMIGIVSLDFQFGIFGRPPYGLNALITGDWTYTEPFFPRDTVNYGTRALGAVVVDTGTMGKTFRCRTLKLTSKPVPMTIILDHVMLQPFANLANGTFGDAVEECKTNPTTMEPTTATVSPHPPSKPSPSNGGMIAGIVIGVLAFVAIIVGIAVFVVRKRRMKEVAYGNLQD